MGRISRIVPASSLNLWLWWESTSHDHVMLHSTGGLKIGRLAWIFQVGPMWSHEPWQPECPPGWWKKRKTERLKAWGELDPAIPDDTGATWEVMLVASRRRGWPLADSQQGKRHLSPTLWGTPFCRHPELGSNPSLTPHGSVPGDRLDSSLGHPELQTQPGSPGLLIHQTLS